MQRKGVLSFQTKPSARRRRALAAVSGLLFVALYPPFAFAPLGWIALAPLLLALDGASLGQGAALAWLAGTIGALGITGDWMFRAARDYFGMSLLGAGVFTFLTNQVFVSTYFVLFGLVVAWVGVRRWRGLFVPMAFVACEYARAHLFSGNPWALLGQAQVGPLLMQVCDLTGVYGLSFLQALTGISLVLLRRTRVPAVVAVAALAASLVYGRWRLDALDRAPVSAIEVGLVQANLANGERGRPEFFAAHLQRYLDLSAELEAHPTLIVWPENAVGFFPIDNEELTGRIQDRIRQRGARLLAGAPRGGERPGVAAIYNSAYLFGGAGPLPVYDKRVLLPFVERAPLRPDDGPFLPGTEATIFDVPGARFGVLICYEALYPELARELVRGGAQLLVNLSNDSWFEAGAGPEQHYAFARLRAVENRVSLVRVTNSGVSAVVDSAGRELARLPSRAAAVQSVLVPVGAGGSFYAEHGDVFALACVAATALAVAARSLGLPPGERIWAARDASRSEVSG